MTTDVLRLGGVVTREQVAAQLGGATRGGIEPSKTTPNIALYSDPEAGERNGYRFDGWSPDEPGVFYFTGDGRNGDQRMWKRNKSVREHATTGKALRLFAAPRGQRGGGAKQHEYLGEFRIDPDPQKSHRREDAPGADRIMRSVIVFRLLAVNAQPSAAATTAQTPRRELIVTDVPPEAIDTTTVERKAAEPTAASRDEAKLEKDFREHLRARGGNPVRKRILVPGHARPLFTDTFDSATNTLYEAKGTATRESIRMAIGQLLDYRRFLQPTPACAVLLQVRPAEDLVELIISSGFGLVYRNDGGFASVNPPVADPSAKELGV